MFSLCLSAHSWLISLRESDARFIRLMAIFAQNRPSDFWLERHLVVLAAVVANNIKARGSVFARYRFFRAALRASLRRHHIPLVKNSLFFFGVNKNVLTLHARHFQIRHCFSPFGANSLSKSLSQIRRIHNRIFYKSALNSPMWFLTVSPRVSRL